MWVGDHYGFEAAEGVDLVKFVVSEGRLVCLVGLAEVERGGRTLSTVSWSRKGMRSQRMLPPGVMISSARLPMAN